MNESNAPILTHLPVLPLKRTVLFPGTMMPLTVGRDRSIAAVEAALKTEDKTLLVVSNRISTIMHADRVLLLDENKHLISSTHQELKETNEYYRSLITH